MLSHEQLLSALDEEETEVLGQYIVLNKVNEKVLINLDEERDFSKESVTFRTYMRALQKRFNTTFNLIFNPNSTDLLTVAANDNLNLDILMSSSIPNAQIDNASRGLTQTTTPGSINNDLNQGSSDQVASAEIGVVDGDSTLTKSSDEVNQESKLVFISSSEERLEREYEERRKKLVKRREAKVNKNENEISWPNPFVFPVDELSFKLSDKLKDPRSFLNELEYNQITSILLDKMLLINR
jgi:hypothetical protein